MVSRICAEKFINDINESSSDYYKMGSFPICYGNTENSVFFRASVALFSSIEEMMDECFRAFRTCIELYYLCLYKKEEDFINTPINLPLLGETILD